MENHMAIFTDESTVLQSVVDKLVTDLSDLGVTESTCFIVLDPDEANCPRGSSLFITVSSMDSHFDSPGLDGSGAAFCNEIGGVNVTIHTMNKMDEYSGIQSTMTDAARGVLLYKKRILTSLTGMQLTSGSDDLLSSLLRPLHSDKGRPGNGGMIFRKSVTFAVEFAWDLGAA